MRCVITGGAGFIGSNIALQAQELGWHVTIIDNFLTGSIDNLSDFKGGTIDCNACDESWTKQVGKPDYIFHLASITDTTIERPQDENVEGFKTALGFAERSGAKLIWASSAGVYGDGPSPMKVGQERRPLNSYAKSKCVMEDMAASVKGIAVGVRYFNVYGSNEGHKGNSASMIYQLAKQILSGRNPRIFKWGEQKRDFIYVKDVVEITLKACSLNQTSLLNAGTGRARSFNDIIEALKKAIGKDLKTEYFDNPYTHFYQNLTEADMTETMRQLEIKAMYSLEEGIKDYVSLIMKR